MTVGWHHTLAGGHCVPYIPCRPQPCTSCVVLAEEFVPCPMSGLPHPTFLPDPGTNPAALASWEVISSSTLFSLLTGNLHQLFRLLSEGAEQTQPQQDTQVGAVWRKLGQTHSIPLHPQPVSMGCVVPWCVAVLVAGRAGGTWHFKALSTCHQSVGTCP